MCWKNTPERYGSISKIFHWLLFLLIAGMLIFGFFLGDIPKDYQGLAYNAHKSIGILILILMVLRLGWTLINPRPFLPMTMPASQKILAHAVHYCLYLAAIAMPIIGILMSNYSGHVPSFFGLFQLNLSLTKNSTLADLLAQWHTIMAWVLIVLIVGHAVAALKHHFVDKDNILRRMMP